MRSPGRHSNQHTFSDEPDRTPLYRTEPDEPGTFPILDPGPDRARSPKAQNTGENPGFRSETLRSHRMLWTPILRIWQNPISPACGRIQAGLVHNAWECDAHRRPAPSIASPRLAVRLLPGDADSIPAGFRFMNWQTPVALVLVAATAAAFLWRRFRPKRFSLGRDTHCGCGSSPTGARPPGFRVEGRRGERPRITLTS